MHKHTPMNISHKQNNEDCSSDRIFMHVFFYYIYKYTGYICIHKYVCPVLEYQRVGRFTALVFYTLSAYLPSVSLSITSDLFIVPIVLPVHSVI